MHQGNSKTMRSRCHCHNHRQRCTTTKGRYSHADIFECQGSTVAKGGKSRAALKDQPGLNL